jgi:hypothetical protein
MTILRWLTALVVGIYGLMNVPPAGGVLLRKLGFDVPEAMRKYNELMDNVSWPHEALWLLVIVFYVTAAVRLGAAWGGALYFWALAFVGDLVLAAWISRNPAYAATFAPGERNSAYIGLAVMAVAGVMVWWLEYRRAA